MRGLGKSTKREAVKKAMSILKTKMILLHETNLKINSVKLIESWARVLDMDFEVFHAKGSAEGLVTMWKKNRPFVVRVCRNPKLLLLLVKFTKATQCCLIGYVYGPHDEEGMSEFLVILTLK